MKSHPTFHSALLQNSKQHFQTGSTLNELAKYRNKKKFLVWLFWETGIIVVQQKIDFIAV